MNINKPSNNDCQLTDINQSYFKNKINIWKCMHISVSTVEACKVSSGKRLEVLGMIFENRTNNII